MAFFSPIGSSNMEISEPEPEPESHYNRRLAEIRSKLLPGPYVPPETAPDISKIVLLHGSNTKDMFLVPDNCEIVLFTKRGEDILPPAVSEIFNWLRNNPKIDTLDLSKLSGRAFEIIIGKILPSVVKVRLIKSGQRCPNINLQFHEDSQVSPDNAILGIYNPRLAKIKIDEAVPKSVSGRDREMTHVLYQTYQLNNFNLKNVVDFILEKLPGQKVRIYMLSCRSGNVFPENAGNLSPPAGLSIFQRELPSIKGGVKRRTRKHRRRSRKN